MLVVRVAFLYFYFYGEIFGVDGIVAYTTLSTLQFVLLAYVDLLLIPFPRLLLLDFFPFISELSIHIHVYAHVLVMIHYHLTILIYTIYAIPHSTLLS